MEDAGDQVQARASTGPGRDDGVPVEPSRRGWQVRHSFQVTLLLAALVGGITGLAVAGFEETVGRASEHVLDAPLWVVMVVPGLGLIVANLLVRWRGTGDGATTDAYVRSYHQRGGSMPLRDLWRKLAASAATLAAGGPLGFEGPSLLIGGTVGSTVQDRLAQRIRRDDAKVLMVAGAAAGVAAVFKAPLTGVVFALEVPYRADLARRALLPTLVAAGSAYVVYVAIVGTQPLLAAGGAAPFDLRDLGGGLLVGLACGALARLGAHAVQAAKHLTIDLRVRVGAAAVGFALAGLLARAVYDEPLHLGPSYQAIAWARSSDRAFLLLAGLLALRAAITWLAIGGGAVGGLFIPLVTMGAVVGALFQHVVGAPNPGLFPTIGIAAFLGAGYRTPLAGVAFVAEATGEPGFLVPALLAAALAQLVMGRQSFSPYQIDERLPDLAPLDDLRVGDIMSANPDTIDAGLSLEDCTTGMLRNNRRWAPVVDGGAYAGLVGVMDIARIPVDEWPQVTVREVMRTDLEPAAAGDDLATAAARLRASGSSAMAVLEDGTVVGVVTLRDIVNVETLLDHLTQGHAHVDTGPVPGLRSGRAAVNLRPSRWRWVSRPRRRAGAARRPLEGRHLTESPRDPWGTRSCAP